VNIFVFQLEQSYLVSFRTGPVTCHKVRLTTEKAMLYIIKRISATCSSGDAIKTQFIIFV
jgi:hypothetical protein